MTSKSKMKWPKLSTHADMTQIVPCRQGPTEGSIISYQYSQAAAHGVVGSVTSLGVCRELSTHMQSKIIRCLQTDLPETYAYQCKQEKGADQCTLTKRFGKTTFATHGLHDLANDIRYAWTTRFGKTSVQGMLLPPGGFSPEMFDGRTS